MPSASVAHEASDRVERLLADLAKVSDPLVRRKAEELARALVELYGAGLKQVLTALAAQPNGDQLIRTIAADGLVGSLLVLHDLHPTPVADRIRTALDAIGPHLGSRTLEFLGIDAVGLAQVALRGSEGCRSSAASVTRAIERAVREAAPELAGVHVDAEGDGPALLQIQPYRADGVHP
jgi:Fe-S cluster biogenesis protein NfuA